MIADALVDGDDAEGEQGEGRRNKKEGRRKTEEGRRNSKHKDQDLYQASATTHR